MENLEKRIDEAAAHYEIAKRIGNLRFHSETANAAYIEHSEKAQALMERLASDLDCDYGNVLEKVRIWFKG